MTTEDQIPADDGVGAEVEQQQIPQQELRTFNSHLLEFLATKHDKVKWIDLTGTAPRQPEGQVGWKVNQFGMFQKQMVRIIQGTLAPFLADPAMPIPFNDAKRYVGLVQLTRDMSLEYRVYEAFDEPSLGMMEMNLASKAVPLPTANIVIEAVGDHGQNVMMIKQLPVGSKRQLYYFPRMPILAYGQQLTQQNLHTFYPVVELFPKPKWLSRQAHQRAVNPKPAQPAQSVG